MKSKISYQTKEQICIYLSGLQVKHISEDDIIAAAKKFNIDEKQYPVVFRAWTNFLQTGGKYIDRRLRNPSTNGRNFHFNTTKKGYNKRNKNVTFDMAAKIITEYMTTDITSRDLSVKHQISVVQFYEWLRELEVSGTLLGKMVLNPKKYYKPTVVDAVWYKKHPNTKRQSIVKLTNAEKANLKRVGKVLESYLK